MFFTNRTNLLLHQPDVIFFCVVNGVLQGVKKGKLIIAVELFIAIITERNACESFIEFAATLRNKERANVIQCCRVETGSMRFETMPLPLLRSGYRAIDWAPWIGYTVTRELHYSYSMNL